MVSVLSCLVALVGSACHLPGLRATQKPTPFSPAHGSSFLSFCAGLPLSSVIYLSIPHTYGLSGLFAPAGPRRLTTIHPPSSAAPVPPVTMVSSQRLKVAEAKFDKNITRKTSTNAKDKVRRRLLATFWGWSRLEAKVHCGRLGLSLLSRSSC